MGHYYVYVCACIADTREKNGQNNKSRWIGECYVHFFSVKSLVQNKKKKKSPADVWCSGFTGLQPNNSEENKNEN